MPHGTSQWVGCWGGQLSTDTSGLVIQDRGEQNGRSEADYPPDPK